MSNHTRRTRRQRQRQHIAVIIDDARRHGCRCPSIGIAHLGPGNYDVQHTDPNCPMIGDHGALVIIRSSSSCERATP